MSNNRLDMCKDILLLIFKWYIYMNIMFVPEAVTHEKIKKNSQPTGNNHSTIHACTWYMSSSEMMDIGFKGKPGVVCAAQT